MISLAKVKVGAVALASAAAITVTAAPGSASASHRQPCGHKQLAAIYKVRHEIDAHRWYRQLFNADLPSAGLAYKLRLSKAERALRFTLYLEQAGIRRQCEGGD